MISHVENRDCMEFMAEYPDKFFELAIVDPPYGIGEGRKHSKRNGLVRQKNGRMLKVQTRHEIKDWDDNAPPQAYFDLLYRKSHHILLFGSNYLTWQQKHLSSGRIFWDKLTAGDFSDGELIWTSLFSGIRRFTFLWAGFQQAASHLTPTKAQGNKSLNERRIHPTQKPVALYKWLLMKYAKPGDKILDTHLGSGSSRIAAHDLGFDFYATELDKDYFDAQEKRYQDHIAQGLLFTPETSEQPTQEALW